VIPHVIAVCTGIARVHRFAAGVEVSAIDKRPREGRVAVTETGLGGDQQGDRAHHGGADQALYAYGEADADHWVAELGRELPPGRFGENLRLAGIDVSAAQVGERWALGPEVAVEVTAPRIPCGTFAGFWDVPDLVERFLATGRPGAYLRVLTPGTLGAGDPVEVLARPDHGITLAEVLRIRTRDHHEAARLRGVAGLAANLRAWAERATNPAPA
jgi:MOSC domain-containing protein YiiM